MAPNKKAKKTNESINSRLALVMKSGKLSWATSRHSTVSDWARQNLSSLPTTRLLSESQRSSTTPCWPRLESITTSATTSSWEQRAASTSEFALCPSPTLEILTSSEACHPSKLPPLRNLVGSQ